MKIHLPPLLLIFLFILVALEYWLTTKRKEPNYRFDTTLVNLSCGIIERSVDVLFIGSMYFAFDFISQHFALFEISRTAWYNWLLALLAIDFIHYWYHRVAHEINLFWGAHVTHHSSEDFNLTVAFRSSSFSMIIKSIFYSVVAFFGFAPEMIIGMIAFSGIFQFFQHTTAIGKLGVLEYIFVTPSAHRVHHGCNEQYLDKNYGSVFIIWDRMFGTFEPESVPACYGITRPFRTFNPFYTYFHFWMELAAVSRGLPGFGDKIKIWFGRPTNFPCVKIEKKQECGGLPLLPVGQYNYICFQMVVNVACVITLLVFKRHFTQIEQVGLVTLMILSAFTVSALASRALRNYYFEMSRLALTLCLVPLVFDSPEPALTLGLLSTGSMVWLVSIRKYFYHEPISPPTKSMAS